MLNGSDCTQYQGLKTTFPRSLRKAAAGDTVRHYTQLLKLMLVEGVGTYPSRVIYCITTHLGCRIFKNGCAFLSSDCSSELKILILTDFSPQRENKIAETAHFICCTNIAIFVKINVLMEYEPLY